MRALKIPALENLDNVRLSRSELDAIACEATGVIASVRRAPTRLGSVDQLLREFSLTTDEGLALMVVAEALSA